MHKTKLLMCVILLAVGLTQAGSTPVQTVDLSGSWDFDPNGGSPTTIQVPGGGWYKQGFTDTREADYSTTISIPDIGQPQVTVLEFGAVNYQADLYIDENFVGTSIQAYTPASFDISEHVVPGNSYNVRVHVKGHDAMKVAGKSIVPDAAGNWCPDLPQGIFRSAELLIYPEVFISDVFVKSSVQNNNLYYDVWVRNASSSSTSVDLSGTLSSWNGSGWNYPSLPTQQVNIGVNSTTKVTVGPVAWNLGSSSYWWPNVPYQQDYTAQLHELNLSIVPSGGGSVLHDTSVRFGFRECTQGSDGLGNTCYFLNGIRVNFRGDSLQGANYDRIDYGGKGDAYGTYPGFLPGENGWTKAVDNYQRLNYNVVRIHQEPCTPYMLDVCDEMGLMIIDETGIRGCGDEQDFIAGHDNMVNHVKQLFSRNRNHPSIVRQSTSNEPDLCSTDSVDFQLDLYNAAMEVDGTRPLSIDALWYDYHPDSEWGGLDYSNFSVYLHYANNQFGQYIDEVYPRSDRPYGQGEFIWPADNTHQGFCWFGTATQAMRAKGASDIRPYALLSAWASVIPGVQTSDMLLELPPWDPTPLYPLYGEDNLPDPWSNSLIQRVQAGFNPVLVADTEYWDFNKLSNSNGDWPAIILPKLPAGESVTRQLTIYNDTFSDTSVDVFWELRQDSSTGTIIDSGVVNATVPLGYVEKQDIIFTTPSAPDGTIIYLVLHAKKGGVEIFRETSECFELDSSVSIPLINAGFEQPAVGKIDSGFDDPMQNNDVPGWNDYGAMSDSGIEDPGFVAHTGDYAAYLMGRETGEGGAYQMTSYTIQAGDVFTLGYWAKVDWQESDNRAHMTGILFWDVVNDPAYEMEFVVADNLSWDEWSYHELTVTADDHPESIGHELGIHFVNTNWDWAALDDVTLAIAGGVGSDTDPPTPDPMTWATLPYAMGSSSISMIATTASDPSGVEYYFTCTAGGGHDSGWQDSTTYTDTDLSPETTYTYTVMARDKSANQNTTAPSSAESATTDPQGADVTNSDIYVTGTVSGSYVDTHTSDNVYEAIEEIAKKKKKENYTTLEHKWTIDVAGGDTVTFYVEAHHTTNTEGDDFTFAYSTNDRNYTDMLTVTKTSDDDSCQSYVLPGDISGTVYIRVTDTNQSAGSSKDTIFIDYMGIVSE